MSMSLPAAYILVLCSLSAAVAAAGPAERPAHLERHKVAYLMLEPRGANPDAFASSAVECPMVVRWKDRWLMFYTGINRTSGQADSTIGVVFSDDLVHWRDRKQVFTRGDEGAFDHGGLSGPFVWSENDQLRMIYVGFPRLGYESKPGRHGLAVSDDGVSWTKAVFNPIHNPGDEGEWNDGCLYKPFCMRHDGKYWLFYNAYGTKAGCEQIGLATSDVLHRWTEHPANPLLRPGDPEKDRDHKIIGDPWIMRRGDTWEMYYFAFDGQHARECLATSRDLIHWRKSPFNPIMDVGPDGTYDDLHCHKPCIITHDGVEYHFFTAVESRDDGTEHRAIALATSKKLPGVPYR